MSRVVVVVQARMGSSRLPGKSLRPLSGQPLIAHVLARADAIGVDAVVLATSASPADDALALEVRARGFTVVRGSESDVLGRVTQAARYMRATTVVRVTGDCPLLAPDVARAVLDTQRLNNGERPYVWNDTASSGYPDGTDVEVFPMGLLEVACCAATLPSDREHVTTWMRRRVPVHTVRLPLDYSRLKLSVDTAEDYSRVKAMMAALPRGDYRLSSTLDAADRCGFV